MRGRVGLSTFGVSGLLFLVWGIWEHAWVAIVAGIVFLGADALVYWLAQPAKRRP